MTTQAVRDLSETLAALTVDDALREVSDYFETRPEERERLADILLARADMLLYHFGDAAQRLQALRPYFDNRADADGRPEGGYIPNDEMKALRYLDAALEQLRRFVP